MQSDPRPVLVVLHAADLETSVRFYREVIGVPLEAGSNDPPDDPWMGGAHAEHSWREGGYFHFAIFPARPPVRPVTTACQVGFWVEDVEAVHQRAVEAAVSIVHGPRQEPWGRAARYLDPDGNIVNVTSR